MIDTFFVKKKIVFAFQQKKGRHPLVMLSDLLTKKGIYSLAKPLLVSWSGGGKKQCLSSQSTVF